jgi:hypothetical protein
MFESARKQITVCDAMIFAPARAVHGAVEGAGAGISRARFWHGFGGELADFGGPVGRPHRGVEVAWVGWTV